MDIQLTNTLGRKKETLKPIREGQVGIYTCGPTVYDRASIGNLRSFTFADVLRRTLEAAGNKVTMVMNITDVGHLTDDASEGEDKLELASRKTGSTAWDIAARYTELFIADMKKLNLRTPEVMPKATDHIPEQIAMIEAIEKAGYTYIIADGVYFDTTKLENYGQLSGQKLDEKEGGARVDIGDKHHAADFALWKFSPDGEKRHMEWESPWGKGFPGWHIECSAMSEKYLGVPFDIHTGGIDHIAVHHENEIAQTLAARGVMEANVWLHNEFLQVDGGKMGKSLGNAYSLDDLAEHGIEPLAYRLFILGAHYRSPINFTWESVGAAQNAFAKLREACRELPKPAAEADAATMERFMAAMADDLNTPEALAEFWMTLNSAMEPSKKSATLLAMDEVLGLAIEDVIARPLVIPEAVQKLMAERETVRAAKDWDHADELRDAIAQLGFVVEDTPDGQKVKELR
ncbi:MAG: cysteine--tRNA ligase [Candidatus Uhrbacteria bacterium]|nr:cysteine--tRNA ligase [Candidatus Uhrbacteria bacterium]